MNIIQPVKQAKFKPVDAKPHCKKKKNKDLPSFITIKFEEILFFLVLSFERNKKLTTTENANEYTSKPLFPLSSDRGVLNASKYEIEARHIPGSRTSRLNKSDIVVRNYEFDFDKNEISVIEKCPSTAKRGENEKDKSSNSLLTCVICFQNSPNAVFMDCGHGGIFIFFYYYLIALGLCYKCAIAIFRGNGLCSMCRKVFDFFLFACHLPFKRKSPKF